LENNQKKEVYAAKRKYKPVDKKIRAVPATLPEEFRVIRNMPKDVLESLPKVLPYAQKHFIPGIRLTEERWKILRTQLEEEGFLTPDEILLLRDILKNNEEALAWDETERGTFKDEYFPPIIIPVIDHEPWAKRVLPIPAGLREKVIGVVKQKIESGVYEGSSSSYRSPIFVVPRKNSDRIRIVHDLQELNRVTIRDSGIPPVVDEVIEETAGHSIYTLIDAMVGYDHMKIDERSRDLTTFQTPLGTFRLTVLPMGWSNSVSIFHGHITHILQDEIPHKGRSFIDDIVIKGDKTKELDDRGNAKVLAENPGVRQFVFNHLVDLNRILHRLGHAGVTVSAKKIALCVPEVSILGHRCTGEGRVPDQSHVAKILEWPPCANLTEVRGFLGVANMMRIFVKDYASKASALTRLTRKDVEFVWEEPQIKAFEVLKEAITTAPVLRPIDYASENPLVLAVDSSVIAAGWLIIQEDDEGKRHPARYGSRCWKEHESRYSQPKLELFGVLMALKAARPYIIGAKNFVLEVDAQYISGMLNKPELAPNATLNRWIATIKLFEPFKLVHVPAERHKGPDGMSRKPVTEEDLAEAWSEEVEDWMEEKLAFLYFDQKETFSCLAQQESDQETIPTSKKTEKEFDDLKEIKEFLTRLQFSNGLSEADRERLGRKIPRFFLKDGKLYRKHADGRHQRVIEKRDRLKILEAVHDELGHKGFQPNRDLMTKRFWWPESITDLKWFVQSCQTCQERKVAKYHIPPTVPEPGNLFGRVHIDTFFMPKHGGYKYVVHAVDSLTGWPEAQALTVENARTIGRFIFHKLLCRFGAIQEIVTDNGSAFVKALDYLAEKYHINHIRISPYNSQAQGIVERQHYGLRESLVKLCGKKLSKWPELLEYCLWAQRTTTKKNIGYSPYYMVYGTEPVFPFDVEEATYLAPGLSNLVSTDSLIAIRARQLQKRPEDLESMKRLIWEQRRKNAGLFAKKNKNIIRDFDFTPGKLVLVRNSAAESGLRNKYLPRYLGPYVVVRRNQGGAYILAEMDGTVSKLRFAAKRLIPFYLRSTLDLPQANELLSKANDPITTKDTGLDSGDESEEDSDED
jgi:hypothetical protein